MPQTAKTRLQPSASRRRTGILRKIFRHPPHRLAVKILQRTAATISNARQRSRDTKRCTYSEPSSGRKLTTHLSNKESVANPLLSEGGWGRSLRRPQQSADRFSTSQPDLELACMNYLDHKFDLLGSGWVQVHHVMNCKGFRGCNYSESSRAVFDRNGEWLQTSGFKTNSGWLGTTEGNPQTAKTGGVEDSVPSHPCSMDSFETASRQISKANLPFSQTLWNLLDDDYTPIDWQRDFKSGYRWNEKTWHKDIPLGHLPGVDVKVPWELARMQHLPQLAVCFLMLKNDPEERSFTERLKREFQNEILDFIATNPPRFGVNWNCTMDAGIRIANWLLAWDLFQAGGAALDEEFETYFAASVYDHALHIVENLENTGEVVGNHYLANLAGLFYAAAYLPSDSETDHWLNFAWSELLREIDRQFLPDGSNFEASTCYHCLSSEIVIWCIALHSAIDPSRLYDERHPHFIEAVSKPIKGGWGQPKGAPRPWKTGGVEDSDPSHPNQETVLKPLLVGSPNESGLAEKLLKMRNFIEHTTKPKGNIHQVGDNDSGRFFKLNPNWKNDEKNVLQENHLDYRSVIAAFEGLLKRDRSSLESNLVSRLSEKNELGYTNQPAETAPRLSGSFALPSELENNEKYRRSTYSIPIEDRQILENLHAYSYPDFGLYIWKSKRCYIAVRCGPVGQNGVGGHAHCDSLAVEVNIDGADLLADPGSCVYTADAELRNSYRSVLAHNSPQLKNGTEPSSLDEGLFRLNDTFDAKCHRFCEEGFLGSHRGYGKRIYRSVRIHFDKIEIVDFAPPELELVPLEEVIDKNTILFSPGYGRLESPQKG